MRTQPTESTTGQPIPPQRAWATLIGVGATALRVVCRPAPFHRSENGLDVATRSGQSVSLRYDWLSSHGVRVRRCSCCIGTCDLPLFIEVRHLSLQSRASPPRRNLSSPYTCDYTTSSPRIQMVSLRRCAPQNLASAWQDSELAGQVKRGTKPPNPRI